MPMITNNIASNLTNLVKIITSSHGTENTGQTYSHLQKGQFSFQSQRKAMPKNAETTEQLHSHLTH